MADNDIDLDYLTQDWTAKTKDVQGVDPNTGVLQDRDYYYNPITGTNALDAPKTAEENMKDTTFLNAAISAIASGASGVLGGQSTLIDTLLGDDGEATKEFQNIANRNRRIHEWGFKNILNDPWGYVKDPQGLTYDVGNMFGSGLALGGETAAAGLIAGTAAPAASVTALSNYFANMAADHGLTSLATALSSKWGPIIIGNVLTTPFEVASESGNVIDDMKRDGVTDRDKLIKAAGVNALIQMPLLTLSNSAESLGLGTMFGKNVSSTAGKLALGAAGITGGALHQSWEEGMQQGANDYAEGKQPGGLTSVVDPLEWSQAQKDQAAAAFGPGMLFGASGAAISRVAQAWNDRNTVNARPMTEEDYQDLNGGGGAAQEQPAGGLDETVDTTATEGPAETVQDEQVTSASPVDNDSESSGGSSADVEGNLSNSADTLIRAMTAQESGGDTSAVNKSSGAYGSMQIMPENWDAWSKEALGHVGDIDNQDDYNAVVKYKIEQYMKDYGPEGAVVAWYAGPGNGERWSEGKRTGIDADGNEYSFDAPQSDGPSVSDYVAQVMGRVRDGGGDVSTGGAVSSYYNPADLLKNEGNTWNRSDNTVDVEDTQDVLKSGLSDVAAVYKDMFGIPLTVTSGNDSDVHADGPRSHGAGVKVDVSGGVLDDADKRHAFIQECEKRGIRVIDEYENPSPNSTGGHLDLDFTDYNGGGGSARASTSGGDGLPTMKEMQDYLKENELQFDPDLNNAIEDALKSNDEATVKDVFDTVKDRNEQADAETKQILDELKAEQNPQAQQEQADEGNITNSMNVEKPQTNTSTATTTEVKGKPTEKQSKFKLPSAKNLEYIHFTHPVLDRTGSTHSYAAPNIGRRYSEGVIGLAQRAMAGDQKAMDLFSKIREQDQKVLEQIVGGQNNKQEEPEAKAGNNIPEQPQAPTREQITQQKVNYAKSPMGVGTTVETDDRTPIKARYRLVDASDIVTSHDTDEGMNVVTNPSYPKQFQPRDRGSATMRQQVIKMSNGLKPDLLLDSQMLNTGAPVVDTNGVVLNGNGRAMAIKAAYRNGKGGNYKDTLKATAKTYGFDSSDVDKMQNPVLVREVSPSKDEIGKIIASKAGGAEMSASEKAVADGKKIKDSTLSRFVDNTAHSLVSAANEDDYTMSLLKDITDGDPGQLNPLLNGEHPSKEGVERARNAVFALAYGEDAGHLLDLVTMDTNSAVKGYTGAMIQVSPVFALLNTRIKQGMRYNINVTTPIVEAGTRLDGLRKSGTKLNIYLQEQALLPDLSNESHAILQYVDESGRAVKPVADFFSTMAGVINNLGNPKEDKTALFQDEGIQPGQVKPIDVIDFAYHVMKGDAQQYALGQKNPDVPENNPESKGVQDANPEPQQTEKPESKNSNPRERHQAGDDELSSESGKQIQANEAGQTGETVSEKGNENVETWNDFYEKQKKIPDENRFYEEYVIPNQASHAYLDGDELHIFAPAITDPSNTGRKLEINVKQLYENLPTTAKNDILTSQNAYRSIPSDQTIDAVSDGFYPAFKKAFQDLYPDKENKHGSLKAADTNGHNFWQRVDGVSDNLEDAFHNVGTITVQALRKWTTNNGFKPLPEHIDLVKKYGEISKTEPEKLVRYDESEDAAGNVDKPHGLYTSFARYPSPHTEVGGYKREWISNPKAKVLDVDGDETFFSNRSLRFGGILQRIAGGGGLPAAAHFIGKDKVEASMRNHDKDSLTKELAERYPNVDWNKYQDQHEMMEAVGGIEARNHGYDAIRSISKKNPEYSEYIALTPNAFLAKARTVPEPQSELEVQAEPAPAVNPQQRDFHNDDFFTDAFINYDRPNEAGEPTIYSRAGVQPGHSLSKDDFNKLNKLAYDKFKGHYSNYNGRRGWIFDTDEKRNRFIGEAKKRGFDFPEQDVKPVTADDLFTGKEIDRDNYEYRLLPKSDFTTEYGQHINDRLVDRYKWYKGGTSLSNIWKSTPMDFHTKDEADAYMKDAVAIVNGKDPNYKGSHEIMATDNFTSVNAKDMRQEYGRGGVKVKKDLGSEYPQEVLEELRKKAHDLHSPLARNKAFAKDDWLKFPSLELANQFIVDANKILQDADKHGTERDKMDAKEGGQNVTDNVSGMAERAGEGAGQDGMGQSGVQSGRPGGSGERDLQPSAQGKGSNGNGGSSVSTGSSSAGRKSGNSTVQKEESGSGRTGSSELPGSIGTGESRVPDDAGEGSKELVESVENRPKHESRVDRSKVSNEELKQTREAIKDKIKKLTPEQIDDVARIETRFKHGNGFLITNGTGTGKTYTGMGAVKLAYESGKKNILIMAPSDDILKGWEEAAGKDFGITLTRLQDTKDAGSGPVTATYANVGYNKALADREWDLIVCDESHKLMSGQAAKPTEALKTMRAISSHPDGFNDYFHAKHGDEIEAAKKLNEKVGDLEMAVYYETDDDKKNELQAQLDEAQDNFKKADKKLKTMQQKEEEYYNSRPKTKVLFLSATPFQYVKDLDYANGYLFDYEDYGPKQSPGYNDPDGKENFYISNFGYSMRYNKLTQPDAEIDSGLMEQAFNKRMEEEGVMHGRMLASPYDYDRGFIRVDAGIGKNVDEGMDWLREHQREYPKVYDYVKKHFDLFHQLYLLEAIKAQAAIPIAKEYIKLGKKIVFFHNFNKGGAENPFNVKIDWDDYDFSQSTMSRDEIIEAWDKEYNKFKKARPDLVNLKISSLKSPIETLKEAFGDEIVIYNGTVPKKERTKAIKDFNDDNGKIKVILVQSDAGQAGISLHDRTGKYQRVILNLGLPTKPSEAIQQEGRTYRFGNMSNAIFRYFNTGTRMEQMAFAQKVAERASTVENLSMGENARALKQAFIDAFEESLDDEAWKKYLPGSPTEGTGGKAKDYANETMSDYDKAKTFYFGKQKRNSNTKSALGNDWFATPEPLGMKMVEWLHAQPGNSLLEPSAGDGAIARWMPSFTSNTVVEPSSALQPILLRNVANAKLVDTNFEELDLHNKYDGIVMNPPFGIGGKMAIEHVAKAYRHLKDGGRLIAIIPDGPACEKRFDQWFYGDPEAKLAKDRGVQDGVIMATFDVPPVAFERAGTKVRTKILVIDKYGNEDIREQAKELAVSPYKLTGDKIKDFFDNLENIDVPDRLDEKGKQYSLKNDDAPLIESNEADVATAPDVTRSLDALKQEVRDAFPKSEITDSGNEMQVKTNAGTITVDLKNNIILGEKAEAKARKAHGMQDAKNVTAEGYYQPKLDGESVIALSKVSAEGAAYHEAFHAAWDMALTPKEKASMRKYFSRHNNGKTVDEAMADGYREWKLARNKNKGTAFGKLFQKVTDFANKAKAILTGSENVHNVMRNVAEGDVWNRTAEIADAALKAMDTSNTTPISRQEYTSAGTSRNQVPAMFKTIPWQKGATNIDIGGGRFNTATDYLDKEHGVKNIVFDPFNRTKAENEKAMEAIKGKAQTVTVANVLNVISEPHWRQNVILQAAKALKPDGTAYFQIYEGNKSGVGNTTQKGKSYQNNLKTSAYIPEVARYFKNVERKGNVLIAKQPTFDPDEKAFWSMDDLATDDIQFSIRDAGEKFAQKVRNGGNGNGSDGNGGDGGSGNVKPHIEVREPKVKRDMDLTQYFVRSPSYIAEDIPKFRPFFQLATKAQEKQENLRNNYNKRLNRIHERYLHGSQDIEEWTNLLWMGDAEQKEYSQDELKEMGVPENVGLAYSATRSMIGAIYKQLNEVRTQVEKHSRRVKREELRSIMDDPFNEITRVEDMGLSKTKDDDGRHHRMYLVTYKRPKTYRTTDEEVSPELYRRLRDDENIQITKVKRHGKNYVVDYEEKRGDIHKLTGYIPHFFHNFFIVAKDDDGNNMVVGSGINVKDAYKKAEEYAKKNPDKADNIVIAPKQFSMGDGSQITAAEISDGQYFKMVSQCEDQLKMNLHEAREFLSDKVRMKGRHRFFGNFLQRKGVQGYEENMDWVLHHYTNAAARYIALEGFKPRAISLFERYFGNFSNDWRDDTLAKYTKQYILDMNGTPHWLEQNLNQALSNCPTVANWLKNKFGDRPAIMLINSIMGYISVAKLGLNPSSALLNLIQILNAYGLTGDEGATMKAMHSALKPTLRDIRVLHDCGVYEDVNISSGNGYTGFRPRSILDATMKPFEFADRYSRKVAALSAYYHAMKEGMSYKEAIEYAKDVNRKANFDYSPADAPGIFRAASGTLFGDTALQFQKYKFKQAEVMHEIIKKSGLSTNIKHWALYFLLAGLLQVPLSDWFNDLFNAMFGVDYKLKAKAAIMEMMGGSKVGRALARVAMYGLLSITPLNVDISRRIGAGDFMASPKDTLLDVLGGPFISTITQMVAGIRNANPIQVLGGLSPALKNIAQAVIGERKDSKGRNIRSLDSIWSRIQMAIGFRNADEAVQSDVSQIRTMKQKEMQEDRESFIKYILNKQKNGEARTPDDIKKMKEYKLTNKKLKAYEKTRDSDYKERLDKSSTKRFKNENDNVMNFLQPVY